MVPEGLPIYCVLRGRGSQTRLGLKTPRHTLEGKRLEFQPQLDSVGLLLGWDADNEQLSYMTRTPLETCIGGGAERNPFHQV